ncbi:tetratricopeptide repeat protein [Aquamicrobium sp. LC103]|uniref:tetratricopeptide repeat protein n=1 Tax=Aquamicrobium sp. LC103 TaxID=1120658 RepID=UPI00069ADD61|nr:tetratricopeptide repeat protein [Aquamicrobium sp. LC103]TKT75382.1 sel1 repeat family protein [Aquamicrobium sp. LC103]
MKALSIAMLAFVLTGIAPAIPTALAADGDRVSTPETEGIDPDRFGGRKGDDAYGAFQRGLYLTALHFATPRAEAGDAAAQTLIAEIYSRGLGVRRDDAKAAEWYGKAAEQGVMEAQFQYSMLLYDGRGIQRDTDRAYGMMEAAADAGHRLAQFNFAQLVTAREPTAQGMAKAVRYYERAAQAGVPEAQYAMAQVYEQGVGGKPVDMAQARDWLLKAARQNFDTAQLDLGTWLVEGVGGDADHKTGFGWLMRAAAGGNVAAQNRLAKLYRAGVGTDADQVAAAAWYMIARHAGLVDPVMEDYLAGLSEEQTQQATERVDRLRGG